MKRFFKCYRMPFWILILAVAALAYMAAGWSASHAHRLESRDYLLERLRQQQQTIDAAQDLSTGLMAANAIIMGSYQWEARLAGKFENQRNVANGRLGPMQRTINELERELEACAGSSDEAH